MAWRAYSINVSSLSLSLVVLEVSRDRRMESRPHAYVMCCPSIGELWREGKFWLALLPTVAAVQVLREMRKLDREWIGWSYLSMAPDIFLPSAFSLPSSSLALLHSIVALIFAIEFFFFFLDEYILFKFETRYSLDRF